MSWAPPPTTWREGSDIDTFGVHLADPRLLLGWGLTKSEETVVTYEPDSTSHDLGKFLRLALGGNPTVLELLWLPTYLVETGEGSRLLAIRSTLLGAEALRNSYGGYAHQQFTRVRLGQVPDHRRVKHLRHCFRLLLQGSELLRTGSIQVAVSEDDRAYLFAAAEGSPEAVQAEYERRREDFEAAHAETVVAPVPDRGPATALLESVRLAHLRG